MSVKMMALVWDSQLPREERYVLLAYADHADHDGNNIWPSVETMAKKTGYSERSIQIITKSLVEVRKILVDAGTGMKGTNKWRIHVINLKKFRPEESSPRRKQRKAGEESAPKPKTKPSIKIPLDKKTITEALCDVFSTLSGIPKPDWSKGGKRVNLWTKPVQEMYELTGEDNKVTKKLMGKAIRRLRKDNITVAYPRAIVKTFISMYGASQTQKDELGGRKEL